jgi:glucose/mannose-6-phosphate isomerase
LSILDQLSGWESLDPKSMRSLMQSMSVHVAHAAEEARALDLAASRRIAHIVVSGMGGSAAGEDIIRAVTASTVRVPLLVCRDYRLPGFIDSSTLVFASSYSGNTEETLAAFAQARAAEATIVCLSSGGKIAALAQEHGLPLIRLPEGLPPRAALGHSTVLLLGALKSLGLVPDMSDAFSETAGLLARLAVSYGPETRECANRAKQIAGSLHGRLVAIYASSTVLEPAAVRWRGQIEENAKNLAFHHVIPEMNHNELVGWELPEQLLERIGAVFLRDKGDHPQVQRRFDLTRELVARKAGVVHEAWSEGESLLARIFSVICLGDFVSLYLACLNSVDPTPVPVIETLKKKLGG